MDKEQNIPAIIEKYIQGKCSKSELEQAFVLFEEEEENPLIRKELLTIWDTEQLEQQERISQKDLHKILDSIHHRINRNRKDPQKPSTKKLFINFSKIAAILIIGAIIGIFSTRLSKSDIVYYTSISPKGSVSQMVLPDNTIVYLNSGSELKYQLNQKKKREVYLEGEAWFDVEEDKKKVFIVHTPYYDVNVHGTEFNVKAYTEDSKVTTTLEEGSVSISSTENFKMNEPKLLKPGEQLVYDKTTNSIELKKVNAKMFTSWKENQLIFIDMSLAELIVLLERKYGVEIKVDDKSLLDLHYDGTIRNETITEVMEILQKTLPIRFKIKEQEIHIIKLK